MCIKCAKRRCKYNKNLTQQKINDEKLQFFMKKYREIAFEILGKGIF